MSSIDPAGRTGLPQPVGDARSAPIGFAPSKGADEPDIAEQILDELAARALACPPQNIAKLSASATKYLLTSLEPAMRLAEQIRRLATEGPDPLAEVLARERRREALELLKNRPRTPEE
ncbi:MAG: hypothetical protein JSV91_06065 [Phycisphaerales bacterium]|nr:MAG: hypothetical protein JSV91_06065 [Phycisphaerales bacterium]